MLSPATIQRSILYLSLVRVQTDLQSPPATSVLEMSHSGPHLDHQDYTLLNLKHTSPCDEIFLFICAMKIFFSLDLTNGILTNTLLFLGKSTMQLAII